MKTPPTKWDLIGFLILLFVVYAGGVSLLYFTGMITQDTAETVVFYFLLSWLAVGCYHRWLRLMAKSDALRRIKRENRELERRKNQPPPAKKPRARSGWLQD